jgi:hypothetical protein
MRCALLHLAVDVDTLPAWSAYLPVVRQPDDVAQSESQLHLASSVVVVEGLVPPEPVSKHDAPHLATLSPNNYNQHQKIFDIMKFLRRSISAFYTFAFSNGILFFLARFSSYKSHSENMRSVFLGSMYFAIFVPRFRSYMLVLFTGSYDCDFFVI